MASRRKILPYAAAALAVGAVGYYLYAAFADQGQGTLAQAPLNIQSSVPPAFMMAVDDSGSMTFQTQFPGTDGEACYDDGDDSFFDDDGNLLTTGSCSYFYVLPGPRNGNDYYGIPPLDTLGFARSPQYNPTYFDPNIKYEPWMNYDGKAYGATDANPLGNASTSATRIDPRVDSTVNLAAKRYTTAETFRIRNGMRVPKGTKYTWGGVGYTAANAFNWSGNTATIYIEYWPATFFLKWTSNDDVAPLGYEGVTRAKVNNACGSGCAMWRYTIESDDTYALQNFANWFSFYGNRNRAMVAGMTRSLVEVSNMRVGYFTINDHSKFDDPINDSKERVEMHDMADTTVNGARSKLFAKLLELDASNSTPNRQAVAAAAKQLTRTDEGAPVKRVCQKNAVMLFTDGFSNQSGPTVGNNDSDMGAPFKDGNSNTMADIVTQYYLDKDGKSPLRPDLQAGQVPIPKTACETTPRDPKVDCQTNLHMNFFGVTLGARGNLYNSSLKWTDGYTNSAIYDNWPKREDNNRSTVDDIWHAAVNTRGEYINARTPADITDAMRRILQQVGKGDTPSGSIALTGSRIGEGSLTVTPFYESTNNGLDWYSKLTGTEVTSDPLSGEVTYKDKWEASQELPTYDKRNILFATNQASGVVPVLKQFALANLGAKPLDKLCANALFARCSDTLYDTLIGLTDGDAIDYLRGKTEGEVKNGGKLRDRSTRLGDIVNSSPVISSPTIDDYGYVSLRGDEPGDFNVFGYDVYLKEKKDAKRVPMVYAGANDGMLHAFNGVTGKEEFAYIPATAVGHMGNLLFPYDVDRKNDQVFSHRYYVDGPIVVSDAHYKNDWETVLVGTSGAGGRSVFALNVSDPDSFDDKGVLWEINDQVADTAIKNNIGYVLGRPVIVPVKVGNKVAWKAIFGNGYGSNNKKAALFVVDIETGSVQLKQAEESGGPSTPNGLGNIVAIDRWQGSTDTLGRDGYADTVYAGDLNGAVWKFDLREGEPTVEVGGKPLFIAQDADGKRQPILGGFEAASGSAGGVMLYFGTGSFSFENDPSDENLQSLYGILDLSDDKQISGRDALQEQRILLDGSEARTTSTTASGPTSLGWYIDLGVSGVSGSPLATGERFVGYPAIANGIVFFPTYDPSASADCSTSGNNWMYGVNALTGAAALNGVHVGSPTGDPYGSGTGAIQLQGDGSAPVKDVAVMTTPRLGLLAKGADPTDAMKAQCSMVVQAAGSEPLYLPRPCGRQSWRQVL